MIKNSKKRKGCWIALILVLVVILIMAGGFSVIKSYLGQISRTNNQSFLETVAPEDENFEADEVGEHYDANLISSTASNRRSISEAVSTVGSLCSRIIRGTVMSSQRICRTFR